MNPYETKLDQFQGPLHKLLELIEGRELEVSVISLAKVTEDFLLYLEKIRSAPGFAARPGEEHIQILADFLSVASRLVLLKSRSLVPDMELTSDEQSDLKDLEVRLKSYAEMKPLFKELGTLWASSGSSFARPYFFQLTGAFLGVSSSKIFYPGKHLSLDALQSSLHRIITQWQGFIEETQVVAQKIVTLEEQMKTIVERLRSAVETRLTDFSLSKNREELIVIFLALLHLAYDQMVFLNQDSQFSDILVGRRIGTENLENRT
jgi:segregation and condensation protein A